jgi:hypothetical protein
VGLPRRAILLPATLLTLAAIPAGAQVAPTPSPGPYVVDIRGTTAGVPAAPAFYPTLPAGASIPARGFGAEAGAHLYVWRLGFAHLGIGASAARVRGTASTTGADAASSSTAATMTLVAPQISLNFGTRDGWSYISGGAGPARIRTTAVPGQLDDDTARDSGWVTSVNVGGGARWFLTQHLAFGFDLRVHRLSTGASTETSGATPRTTLTSVGVGLSLR